MDRSIDDNQIVFKKLQEGAIPKMQTLIDFAEPCRIPSAESRDIATATCLRPRCFPLIFIREARFSEPIPPDSLQFHDQHFTFSASLSVTSVAS
jgi:hypothetical protein